MREAIVGSAVLGLGLLGWTALAPASAPVARRVVWLEGEGVRAGWYEADWLGALPVTAWADQPADGERVRVVAGWGFPERPAPPQAWSLVATGPAGDDRVSLNRASLAALEGLPRVGPVLARRIADGRPYATVEELLRVPGVGPVTLDALRARVRP